MFGNLGLRSKLLLPTVLSALVIVGLIATTTDLMRRRMISDRIEKLHAVVTMAESDAEWLQDQARSGSITSAQAMNMLKQHIHTLRFGGPTDYFVVSDSHGVVLMHGGDPSREGKPTTAHDEHGRLSTDLARDLLRNSDGGAIWYKVAKPGQSTADLKVTYVSEFRPWNLTFMAGAWVADIDAEFYALLIRLGVVGAGLLIVAMSAAWMINRDVAGMLRQLQRAMSELASGNLAIEIPGAVRRDEVGAMSAAVVVFKRTMQDAERLRAAREEERRTSQAENRATLHQMATRFEVDVGQLVSRLSSRSTVLESAARSMADVAQGSTREAALVVSSAEQASGALECVAGAAEQLTASIAEISRQVDHSAEMTSVAAKGARDTDSIVQTLAMSADRIGTVIGLISDVASKTNLLALNATIEASRAGDAGRGFAVVAAEVKMLASQTSLATQEIGSQINDIQAASRAAVAAIVRITATLADMSTTAVTIASAVEEQNAATSEIARRVQQTLDSSRAVTLSGDRVRTVAGEAGAAADRVATASSEVSQQTRELAVQVEGFVKNVRAA